MTQCGWKWAYPYLVCTVPLGTNGAALDEVKCVIEYYITEKLENLWKIR